MRKTNFLSSWGAKLAFAAVVLTSPLLTSCEQEDLDATFKAGPAKVTLEVDVIDALTGKDLIDQAAISVSNSSFIANGTAEFASGVTAQTITVTATVGEGSTSADVEINATKVGGAANYYVKLVLADGLEIAQTTLSSEESTAYATFAGVSHDANHSHAGITGWYANATDYIQAYPVSYPVKVEYTNFSDLTEGDIYSNLDQVYVKGIEAAYNEYVKTPVEEVTKTEEIKVSAWAYFSAWVTVTKSVYQWSVQTIHSDEVAATWTANGIACTELETKEIPHPSHAGHYQHGHGHGINSNAGGGIVIAE